MHRRTILSILIMGNLLSVTPGISLAARAIKNAPAPSAQSQASFITVLPRHFPSGASGTLKIRHFDGRSGKPISRFEPIHERLQHVIAIGTQPNGDFSFTHRHPKMNDGFGSVRLPFPHKGWYGVFVEAKPAGKRLSINRTFVSVGSSTTPRLLHLQSDLGQAKRFGNLIATLTTSSGNVAVSGRPMELNLDLRTTSGKPVRGIRPYLGANGHAVVYDPVAKEALHLHATHGGQHGNTNAGHAALANQLTFPVTFSGVGVHPIWVQVKIGASVRKLRFNVEVLPAPTQIIRTSTVGAAASPNPRVAHTPHRRHR